MYNTSIFQYCYAPLASYLNASNCAMPSSPSLIQCSTNWTVPVRVTLTACHAIIFHSYPANSATRGNTNVIDKSTVCGRGSPRIEHAQRAIVSVDSRVGGRYRRILNWMKREMRSRRRDKGVRGAVEVEGSRISRGFDVKDMKKKMIWLMFKSCQHTKRTNYVG